jgi:hypothetical protein
MTILDILSVLHTARWINKTWPFIARGGGLSVNAYGHVFVPYA